jgi:hypothetical protein
MSSEEKLNYIKTYLLNNQNHQSKLGQKLGAEKALWQDQNLKQINFLRDM